MGVLTDNQIISRTMWPDPRARLRIDGFQPKLVKEPGKPSWGLTSNGYDCRLDRYFKWLDAMMVAQGKGFVEPGDDTPWVSHEADFIVIPAGHFVLAQTKEYIRIPRDVMGAVYGKSTIARIAADLNTTPLEPEWGGKSRWRSPTG